MNNDLKIVLQHEKEKYLEASQNILELKKLLSSHKIHILSEFPKIQIYNKTKADLKDLLRSYGYKGKELDTLIHRLDPDKYSYIDDKGSNFPLYHNSQYALYSLDKEVNDDLQVTLILDEVHHRTAYLIDKSKHGQISFNRYGYHRMPETKPSEMKLDKLINKTSENLNTINDWILNLDNYSYDLRRHLDYVHSLLSYNIEDKFSNIDLDQWKK